jgi:TolB-like protein/Tfp pilus assembly protein PilF
MDPSYGGVSPKPRHEHAMKSGDTLGPYRVREKLGEGGMGEVYRATDTKLGRDVALKVLPAAMAGDADRLARFEREARSVAALNHPHIVTIYSVEECEGLTFLTMELVEGGSLDARIPDGGVPLDEILAIGAAIAEALDAAHQKGIVHRDLKPGNVMLTADGRVKVLDFGLAKDLRTANRVELTVTAAGLTQAGMVMGTPAYMSPEQLAGRPVDRRTDIFSLGVLLYEMASGQRPFEGASSIELASAILRDVPRRLDDGRADLPAALATLVQRCLEKDRDRRMQTAREVVRELSDIARRPSSRSLPTADSTARRAAEGFWVAVLPFRYTGSSESIGALADGLLEDTARGLSRFSYLRVVARSSTAKYAGQPHDAGAIGQDLGARYVLDGSIRQAGSTVRVAAQLVDAATGVHLWADTYDRHFDPDRAFELQDELVPRIVSTCGDRFGVLARSISEAVRDKEPAQLTPYEALMRSFGYHHRLTPGEHAIARDVLERAVETAPTNADCWAMLSWIYAHEFGHGFNPRPGSLDRALAAARRAVDLASSNALAYQTLAVALFFRKDYAACLSACERAMALNPLDGSNEPMFLVAFMGDWERGCSLIRRAMELNPHHPAWYRVMLALHDYQKRAYRAAIDEMVKANIPGVFWSNVVMAAAHGQLGDPHAARAALDAVLAQKPEFRESAAELISRWFDARFADHLLEGLRLAGLGGAPAPQTTRAPRAMTPATPAPVTPPAIAVLPFADMSAERDQAYFGDGLAEEIIHSLSRTPGLRVIARTSAFAFRDGAEDIRSIAQALDVGHVLEGSVRRAGGRIRVTAQLISAADGAHLWNERYDRELSDVFAVQDEISAAIAAALRVRLVGDSRRYVPTMPAYDAYLRARHHQARVTPSTWDLAKKGYESAVELDPAFGLAHLGLGFYWLGQAHFGTCSPHDAVAKARKAAQRALELDATLPEAHALLGALAAQYDFDWDAAQRHFDSPGAREAGWSLGRPLYGGFLMMKGDIDGAIACAERAIAEDPFEVWPRMNLHAYLQAAGKDQEAYEQVLKVLEIDPNLVVARVSVAHFHHAWAQLPQAVSAAREAYAVAPWYPDARATLAAMLRTTGAEHEADELRQSLGSGDGVGDSRAQAVYHLLCGDIETGADWTERALAERDPSMMYYLRFVICRPLRRSARWPHIARMVNRPDWRE